MLLYNLGPAPPPPLHKTQPSFCSLPFLSFLPIGRRRRKKTHEQTHRPAAQGRRFLFPSACPRYLDGRRRSSLSQPLSLLSPAPPPPFARLSLPPPPPPSLLAPCTSALLLGARPLRPPKPLSPCTCWSAPHACHGTHTHCSTSRGLRPPPRTAPRALLAALHLHRPPPVPAPVLFPPTPLRALRGPPSTPVRCALAAGWPRL